MPTNRIVGTPGPVVTRLEVLARETDADEIMIFTFTHGLDERVRSLELLAQGWQDHSLS
jgi:alkanesulfonate monooxygenase SsuD/methylene tetrahydromethanopterin reductase-like flavin-dependent oxidoreductase (luciferase family)